MLKNIFLNSLALVGLSIVQASAAEVESDELNDWARGYFEERLEKTYVPGAVLVIVKDGEPVVMQGFGVAAVESGEPVDPVSTLFRVGSITKVMTAIATLQLIEEGVIDPHADVNDYLEGIRVPETFGTVVTVDHLLTHKGGFGSELRGAEAPHDSESKLSSADIQRLLVPRVRPPGRYPAYDNNGWGLLGMVAAHAAGTDYRSLIQTRVFEPLGMISAGIGLPDERRALAARPHNISPTGDVWPIDYSILTTFEQGAGNATLTGADMAKFMTALLQRGELNGVRVLSDAAFGAMTDFDSNRLHPAMPGLGRSVYEYRPAGRRAIRHDGGISGFVSSMVLYPDANIGAFFSINAQPHNPFNSDSLSTLIAAIRTYLKSGDESQVLIPEFLKILEFHEKFAEKYIPAEVTTARVQGGRRLSEEELRQLEGNYRSTRSEYGVFIENLQVRLLGGTNVSVIDANTLRIGGDEYSQSDSGVFHKIAKVGEDDEDTPFSPDDELAFAINDHGVFMGSGSLFISRKVAAYETLLLTVVPLILLPLLVLSGVFYVRNAHAANRKAAKIAGIVAIAWLVGVLLEAEYANAFVVEGRTALIFLWRLLLAASAAGLAIVAYQFGALVLHDIRGGWNGFKSAFKRFHHLLVAVSAVGLVLLSLYWDLATSLISG